MSSRPARDPNFPQREKKESFSNRRERNAALLLALSPTPPRPSSTAPPISALNPTHPSSTNPQSTFQRSDSPYTGVRQSGAYCAPTRAHTLHARAHERKHTDGVSSPRPCLSAICCAVCSGCRRMFFIVVLCSLAFDGTLQSASPPKIDGSPQFNGRARRCIDACGRYSGSSWIKSGNKLVSLTLRYNG